MLAGECAGAQRQEQRSPRCFNGLRYHCGFPQVKIVCQQIRWHSVHNFAVAKARDAPAAARAANDRRTAFACQSVLVSL